MEEDIDYISKALTRCYGARGYRGLPCVKNTEAWAQYDTLKAQALAGLKQEIAQVPCEDWREFTGASG
jgi:hypothetical protein